MEALGEKKFRAKQIYEWLHARCVFSFEEMTNLSKALRQKLEELYAILPVEPFARQESKLDGTNKFLFELYDGNMVESCLLYTSEMIRLAVEAGRQAVVLIPEIALTYQTVMRFYRCFGDRVSIMHSRLSAGERYDQMMRAKAGEVDVMIGPRSALFTPFPNLGLIVIDEEHETTYKSEQVPRYHARETAIARSKMEGASVVLGSATPSMEAMYLSLIHI